MDEQLQTEFYELVGKLATCQEEGFITKDELNFIISQLLACKVEKTISDSINAN